jgi:lactoylglutathione lyase
MELGAFSVSLSVKNLEVSKSFYEKLGFHVFGGDAAQNWLIMKNGDHIIGLFQGMFDKNMLTFNPVGKFLEYLPTGLPRVPIGL